ncbi:MAG: PocR ligand-binding domain-containing protein [Syntrophobacter sp.]
MLPAADPMVLIHEGHNSKIYHQIAGPHGRPAVIKVPSTPHTDPSQLIKLSNEYELTKDLTIEGVRNAISLTRLEDKPALVMEYVAGQTLRQSFVERRQPLIVFLRAAIRIAQALAEVHQHHIIHMNINSDNILVDPETGHIKLIDFGLASRLDSQAKFLGNPERLPGTLAYISPEQTGRMNRVVDYRTDLYSLGVTFHEMLTGRLPFESDDPLALVHAHMAKAPRPVTDLNPDVPRVVSEIVLKLLAKNAEDRYQSAFGLKVDLEKCLAFPHDPRSPTDLAMPDFQLGREDHSGQFHISEKLYGRSDDVATLLATFDRAAAGSQELLLVTGRVGVGKSALVAEIHKPVTRERGYFISGKFDQYQQNQPYAAFTQAFEQFADLLLSESELTLERWRDRIMSAVNGNGAVLTEVMPGLERIIGKQPPVSKLGGAENRNRFHLTFQTFVKAISTGEHPLVVFIDDWQWADLASLELLKVLLTGEKISHLLIIGAYRDSEVDQAHPFMITLNDITGVGAGERTIHLENLGPGDVHQLIAESLAVPMAESQVLAELVYSKTRGNAFFTRQFLRALYEEGWLRFDFDTRHWIWDIAQLEAQDITDNVVELMAGKLRRLSPETGKLLQLAACMGNEFDLRTLALISQTNGPVALELLSEALAEDLLLPLDSYYKLPEMAIQARFGFPHDRVQQAAYAQISPLERQTVHLAIGRLLLAGTTKTDLNQRIFSIVQHYNHSGHLIKDQVEKLMVAELNMKAADLAYEAAAFGSARGYLEKALSLMPPDAWTSRYDIMLKLHSQLSTVLYLTGDFVQLERIYQTTEAHAHSMADTAQVKQAKIQSSFYRGDFAEAIELGLSFVQAMGVPVNRNVTPEEAFNYLHETAEWLTEERIAQLAHLPEASAEVGLILELSALVNGPLYNTNTHLMCAFISQITRLCVERGVTPWAPVTLMTFAILLSSSLHDIPKARLLAAASMQLVEDRYRADSPVSPLRLVIGGFIRHRHDHLKNTIPVLADGVQRGLISGTFPFVGYCAWWQTWHLLFAGAPLDKVEAVCGQSAEICQKVQIARLRDWCFLVQQAVFNLQGKSEVPWELTGEVYDEREKLPLALQLNDLADVFRILFFKAWLHCLFGQWRRAVGFFKEAESYLLYGAGTYIIPLFYLYDTLAHAALADDKAADEVPEIVRRINRNLEQLEVWVRFAPMNHQHKKDLMEAEKARLEGRHWDAAGLYEKAIQGAKDNGFLNEEALAYELYARFWTGHGKSEIARIYVNKAHDAYGKWGATAKAEQLRAAFKPGPGRFQPPVLDSAHAFEPARPAGKASSTNWLDITSLLKTSQALTQTVRLTDLLENMVRIFLENAGAEKVLILHREEGMWFVVASGRVQDPTVTTGQRMPVPEAGDLSVSIFNYVVHSGKPVVLESATLDPHFGAEPYLREKDIKSVLCLPIYHKGELDLVIYLENNLAECAFTDNRLEFLRLLSGHMAISFENALIYESLRTSIAERKRAEETLKESEERLRLALEGTSDGIWDWNLRTGKAYFSPRYYTMLGYEPDEFPACYESWRQLVHPEDAEQSERAVYRAIEENTPYSAEFRFRAKNGEWLWILGRAKVAEFDLEGKAVRVAGSHTDITERKRAEEALSKRIVALTQPLDSARGIAFEDLFNISDIQHLQDLYAKAFGVAALMTQPDGTPITQPSNFTRFCGEIIRKTPKGLENCHLSDAKVGRHNLSGPNVQKCLSAGLWNAGASITVGGRHVANWLIGQVRNEAQEEEEIIAYAREIGADETTLRAAYREVPIMTGEQFHRAASVLFAIANQLSTSAYQNIQQARFIAERKQAEESLHKYERIVSTSQDLIALINRDYVYEAVNDSLLTAHNKTREEIIGKTVFGLFGESFFRTTIQPRFDQALSGQTIHVPVTYDFAGAGHRIMDVTYFPMFDEAGKVTAVVLNARDITETRKLEEQLLQSQKIESIGTLAGGVAHEINNPINGIMNYAQLIVDRVEKNNPVRDFAQEILHETRRIATIVRNLLTFARREKQSHSPARMSDLVSAVLSLIQTVMRHDQITLELSIPADLPSFKCRSQQIQQVLMNLMTNARDALNERYPGYSPDKILRFTAEEIMKDGHRFIRTTIEDKGPGIPLEIRDRIFDPFFTTKPKETGTGLGLSISYGIVRDHGGELSVESEVNQYTRFYMDLPVNNGWTLSDNRGDADG